MNRNELLEKQGKLQLQLRKIQWKLQDINANEYLPKLKRKFEGKYFKYRNSYSCPEGEKDRWWLYIRVDKVKCEYNFECLTFQIDKDGKMFIERESRSLIANRSIKITKREFYNAFRGMIRRINNTVAKEIKVTCQTVTQHSKATH